MATAKELGLPEFCEKQDVNEWDEAQAKAVSSVLPLPQNLVFRVVAEVEKSLDSPALATMPTPSVRVAAVISLVRKAQLTHRPLRLCFLAILLGQTPDRGPVFSEWSVAAFLCILLLCDFFFLYPVIIHINREYYRTALMAIEDLGFQIKEKDLQDPSVDDIFFHNEKVYVNAKVAER